MVDDMEYFSVKNWQKHQHYKDRNPPWIKLHKDLLHDYEFTCLQDASKLHLMLIWLLASQMDNKIPADAKWLKNALHVEDDIDLKAIYDAGFIELSSNMLASCKQHAMPETETEAKRETEAKTKKSKSFKPPAIEELKQYISENNYIVDPHIFLNHYQSNGWMRGKNKIKDWKACVRTWHLKNKSENKEDKREIKFL